MPVKTNAQLAAYFNTGDQPSESNFGDLIDTLQPTPVLISDGTATLTEAATACRINVLPDVASTSNTYDLPTPSAGGIWYRFIYGGAAADDENHIFATATTDETVLFKGGVIPFWPDVSVVDNIMGILGSLSNEGLLGLVGAFVLYHILKKK